MRLHFFDHCPDRGASPQWAHYKAAVTCGECQGRMIDRGYMRRQDFGPLNCRDCTTEGATLNRGLDGSLVPLCESCHSPAAVSA